MKKITRILAVSLAAGGVFALAACGSGSSKTTTSPNWNVAVGENDLTGEEAWFSYKETAAYTVSYEGGSNSTYSFAYDTANAVYETAFYATTYDWNDASVPEQYREDTQEYVYVYETTLSIAGTLTFTSTGETLEFEDSATTVSYFRSADDNLQPVYSRQDIVSHAPANLTADSLSASYITVDRLYESFYSKNSKQVTVKTTVRQNDSSASAGESEKTVSGLYDSGYSLFDTNMREIALRSFSTGSHTYSEFIPINGAVSTYQSSSSGSKTLDKTDTYDLAVITALDNAKDYAQSDEGEKYVFVGTVDDDGATAYQYIQVTATLDSALNGSSPTYSFVNVANTRVNAGRAVMVRKVCPIYFASGTLTYTLTSLSRTAIE